MAQLDQTAVTGLDINEFELGQAARVFGDHDNLAFVWGDVMAVAQPADRLDVIVLATTIQYRTAAGLVLGR